MEKYADVLEKYKMKPSICNKSEPKIWNAEEGVFLNIEKPLKLLLLDNDFIIFEEFCIYEI